MGRIILTNNDNWCQRLQDSYECLLGLPVTGSLDDGFHLRVYRKKKVQNENYLKNDNGIIATNGTMFYKGLMNRKALEALLRDFIGLLAENEIGECIKTVRKDLIGSYCIIIVQPEFIVGFVDETSMYPVYYHRGEDGYLLTNTFYNVNECCRTQPNELAAMEYSLCSSIVGNETPFIDVYRLLEDDYFFLNTKTNQVAIKKTTPNHYMYSFNNYEEAIALMAKEMEKMARIRSEYLKHTLLFTTGGIDSRMELALHNYYHDSMIVGYWQGDDVITNGTDQDLDISKKLAEVSNLPFILCDVSEDFDECLGTLSKEELSKFGEYACIYSHNEKWLNIPNLVSENNISSIGFGSLDEIIRDLPQVEQFWNEKFKFIDLVKNVKMRTGVFNTVISYDELVGYITEKLRKAYADIKEPLSMEEAVSIFNRGRLHSNTVVDAYINLYYYDFNICGQKRIVDLVESLPYEWRNESKIAVTLTRQWHEELMVVPYFSHHHTVMYNSSTNRVEETNKTKMEMKLRQSLKGTILYKPLVKIGHKFRNKSNKRTYSNRTILQKSLKTLSESDFVKESKIKINNTQDNVGFDLASLARIVAEIRLIDISRNVDRQEGI